MEKESRDRGVARLVASPSSPSLERRRRRGGGWFCGVLGVRLRVWGIHWVCIIILVPPLLRTALHTYAYLHLQPLFFSSIILQVNLPFVYLFAHRPCFYSLSVAPSGWFVGGFYALSSIATVSFLTSPGLPQS